MMGTYFSTSLTVSGGDLVGVCQALANPHMLRVLRLLGEGRSPVSQIALDIRIRRPLWNLHRRKSEQCGLVFAELDLYDGGKSMKL